MLTETLACNHCGAPLDVPEGTRFATCGHCGSRLAIHRTPTAQYTEVLEEIRLQNELERVDREWEMERQQWLVRGKDGSTSPPSVVGVVFGLIFAAVAAGMLFVGCSALGAFSGPGMSGGGGFMTLWVGMLALFIVLGIAGSLRTAGDAGRYRAAETDYQRRRAEVERQLDRGGP